MLPPRYRCFPTVRRKWSPSLWATEFYRGAFGWETSISPGMERQYHLAGTVQKIEEAGGNVLLPKTPVLDVGLYAMAADSEGNAIGIWEEV